MPQAAVPAIAAFLGTVGFTAVAATFFANVFVYAAAAFLLNRISRPKRRGAGLGSGTEVNYYDSGASIRIVYGKVRLGGMETIPATLSGEYDENLHKVLTIAGHEIDSYTAAHFDTTPINNSFIGPMAFTSSDGQVTGDQFSGHAWIRRYRGTSTDSADRILCDVSSARFGLSRAPGIAKAAITLKYNADVYKSIPTVTFTIQGKRCYDARLDSSPGADPTNPAYSVWTQNAALCLTDYLMATYGGEYSADDIDWTTVVTAANACDATVNIPGSTTQPRYTCNGVLMATEEFTRNVRALVDCMLGRVIFRDGKWRIYAGSWQTPTFTIQKSDWISGLSIRFEQGRKKRFNRMRCWFVDAARDWQRVECMPRSNSTYRTADGGETIDAETEQLLCTNEYETQRKTEFLLRQSRNQITVTGRLPPRFQDVALWDTGTIVFDHLGWSSKTFRCTGMDLHADGSMDGVFLEEQSGDWTDLDAAEYNTQSTTPLPGSNVTRPSEPQGFSAVSQVNGTILFSWTRPVIQPLGTRFQIIRSTAFNDPSVGTVIWDGDASPVPLVVPTSRHWYYVRATANSLNSPYQPNTLGLLGEPGFEADNTFARMLVADSEIRGSAIPGKFWGAERADVYSLSLTGGEVDGRILVTAGVNTPQNLLIMMAMPNSPYARNIAGRQVRIVARMRPLTSIASRGFGYNHSIQLYGWSGVGSPCVTNSNIRDAGGLTIIVSSVTNGQPIPVNQYTNWTTVVSLTPVLNPSSYPYVVAGLLTPGVTGVAGGGASSGDTFEYDSIFASML